MFARTQSQADRDAVPHVRQQMRSYVDVLQHHAALRPNLHGIHEIPNMKDVRRTLTYAQMDLRCRAIAAQLQLAGAVGQRALLAFDNDADYLLSFIACAYAGVIAVPLFARTQRKHLDRFAVVANDCDARFVLTTSAAEARHPELCLPQTGFPKLQVVMCDLIQDAMAEMWRPTEPEPGDLAYLQYTSGSTGSPRGVMVSHGNLMYQAEYLQSFVPHYERVLSWLPLYHDMGLILGALQSIYGGKTLWLSTPTAAVMHPRRWLKAISDFKINASGAPNFVFDLCVNAIDIDSLEGADLSCWTTVFNAAEPIRASTIERFVRKFEPLGLRADAISPAYGLAEATLAVAVTRYKTEPVVRQIDAGMLAQNCAVAASTDRPQLAVVSSGKPGLHTEVRIVDPVTLKACKPNTVGEIWVGGPTVAGGYWQQPEITAETFHARIDGESRPYLRTGDLGFMDEESNIFVTGRSKDLIIVAGKNHYPQDIEATVTELGGGIRSRGAVALSVERNGSEALALLVEVERQAIRQGFDTRSSAQRIRQQVSHAHNLPVADIVFITPGQLPMTTSGKIQRAACLAMLLAGSLQTLDHNVA